MELKVNRRIHLFRRKILASGKQLRRNFRGIKQMKQCPFPVQKDIDNIFIYSMQLSAKTPRSISL